MTISTEEHRRRLNSSISDFVQAAVANKRPNYQRLIDQALQGVDLNEQAISLDAVVAKLAQVVGGLTTAKTRRAGEQASQQLFKQLSARLFEQKLLKLFVEIYANLIIEKRSTISYVDVLSKVEEFRGDYSKLDSEERFVLGRYWFIQQVLELAGKDFSYAMNFALCLLEAFTEGLRSFLIHGHSSSKYYPGGDCAQRLVYLSAATIPRNRLSMRGWLDRLLEGLNQDNDALDEVLHSIILVLTYEYRDSKFALYIYDPTMEEFGSPLETPRASRPVFWITSVIEPYFRKWTSRYDALGKARKTQVKAVLDRFQQEKERMVEIAETQRRAILERPKRALRPAGYDHVEIGVTPLYYSGIRSVAFHTEGYDFPDMELHFVVRKETPHLIVFKGRLIGLRLQVDDVVVDGLITHNTALLKELLEIVIIDALFHIMVAERGLRPKQRPQTTIPGGEGRGPDQSGGIVPVRAHYQRLQEGHVASETARENLKEALGWRTLPEGHTFVAAYRRGALGEAGEFVYSLPSEPTAKYDDADFFKGNK